MVGYRERWRKVLENKAHLHPLWSEAIEVSGYRSIAVPEKLQNMFWLVVDELPLLRSQNIVEFGSYRGGSALFLGYLLQKLHPEARLWSLDTFEGMPPTTAHDEHGAGDFRDADLPGFHALIEKHGLPITTIKGLCQDTFPDLAGERFGLAHVDVDIYEAVKYSAFASWEQLCLGGFLVFDDANAPSCLGATRAAEEFAWANRSHLEQAWPHWVHRK